MPHSAMSSAAGAVLVMKMLKNSVHCGKDCTGTNHVDPACCFIIA
jgi:hypothetical protein